MSSGITAIVGPNGSGKSNVADGVRWVLGEQSGKHLRTKKLEDVIFAGSSERAFTVAEVTITLDNEERWLPIDVNEVVVTRRAFWSGESEYLINHRLSACATFWNSFMGKPGSEQLCDPWPGRCLTRS